MRQNLGDSFKQHENKWKRSQEIKTRQHFNPDGDNHRWIFPSKQAPAHAKDRNHHRAQQQMLPPPGLWASGAFQNTTHREKALDQHWEDLPSLALHTRNSQGIWEDPRKLITLQDHVLSYSCQKQIDPKQQFLHAVMPGTHSQWNFQARPQQKFLWVIKTSKVLKLVWGIK